MFKIYDNKRYLEKDGKPMFYLADTSWLMFSRLNLEECKMYIENRRNKNFNFLQVTITNQIDVKNVNGDVAFFDNDVTKPNPKFFNYAKEMVKIAKLYNINILLLPAWGSLVLEKYLNMNNMECYITYLLDLFKDCPNIIYCLGGDIKPLEYIDLYKYEASLIRKNDSNRLIAFHPFGRCSSSYFFQDDTFDFNMFQSGHRRYDQKTLSLWDDNNKNDIWYGEDNYKYAINDQKYLKPTFDSEPSYEEIPQGLHNTNEPYWKSYDVRRYAYWSVFQGCMGFTYGHNAIIQFYNPKTTDPNYGPKKYWNFSLDDLGAVSMSYMYELMTSVDFYNGRNRNDLILDKGEKYEYITAFGSDDFIFIYNYLGREFTIDLKEYKNFKFYYMNPSNNKRIEAHIENGIVKPILNDNDGTDILIIGFKNE